MISIVIPSYNEAESLSQLHQEIDQVLRSNNLEATIVIVDDGSKDASWKVIEELARTDKRVRGLGFRRNFGKAVALNHGFSESVGEYVITMDADLQDDPREIPKLLATLNEGFDMVVGWKRTRHDPWHKVIPSRMFNWLIGRLSDLKLHDHNCGLKAYRTEVLREIALYGEMHRFITLLANARGFRVTEIEVKHRPRQHGWSKYGMSRFIKGFLDLLTVRFITTFGEKPLHLLGGVGLVLFLAGFLSLTYLGVLWSLGHRPIGNRPLLFYGIALLLLGINMISFGVLAELITWKFAQQGRDNQQVSAVVRRTANR